MASQALYRRYRSQTFDELVGQEHIVQTLRNAMLEGRIAHAYLFTGPRGVGKTSVARLLAKAVNCTAPLEQRPCGVCESCVSVAEGRAVDVIEMDAASHTSVEDAREIIERVQFRPSIGAYKVYIIDEVHMLSTAAFNALLKTLEEPPEHALFILATTENHKVPATILSRCQRFTFNRHTVANITAHLQDIAASEGYTLESGVPEALARAATGSMRDGLSLLDQLMAYGGGVVRMEQVQNLLGATESEEVVALAGGLINGDLGAALRAVAGVVDQGADLRQFARDIVEHLRALMLLKAGGDDSLIDATENELIALHEQAQMVDLAVLLRWVRLFSALDGQIRGSAIPQLPLEMAVVEALAAPVAAESYATPAPPRRTAQTAPPPQRTAPAARPTPPPQAAAKPTPQPAAHPAPEPAVATETPGAEKPADSGHPPVDNAPIAPQEQEAEESATAADSSQPPEQVESFDPPAGAAPEHDTSDSMIASENAAVAALEEIEAVWQDIVQDVRMYNPLLQGVLKSGIRPVDVKDEVVILEAPNQFLYNKLSQLKERQLIERVLNKRLSKKYTIDCVLEEQRPKNASLLREQIREARKDELTRVAMNILSADIISVQEDEL